MLRRTHLSWFNENGGKNEIRNIIGKFENKNIEKETLKELDDEGLLYKNNQLQLVVIRNPAPIKPKPLQRYHLETEPGNRVR